MGNCFGKEKTFPGEGRTLGATNPTTAAPVANNARSTVPQKRASMLGGGGGRTLGTETRPGESPGAAAARAAEERQKAAQGKGKLGKQLDAQKAQTQSGTLAQSARENVAARDADAATETRNWN